MSAHHVVDRAQAEALRQALMSLQDSLRDSDNDACDAADLEEVIAKANEELERQQPNVSTLSTYLNSIARSVRHQSSNRSALADLDAAMRDAHVPTNWEH
jgi:translation initiation factor 2B subunit (eIF-2B alpha/beta/delta family)